MDALVAKYAAKMVAAGLGAPGDVLVCGLDDRLVASADHPALPVLAELFERVNVSALAFLAPAEPYRSVIDHLAGLSEAVRPEDCETRTFLHDLPVVRAFAAEPLAAALRRRKGVIAAGRGLVAHGSVSPEQAFVTLSSMCFACFVKFFSDYLAHARAGTTTAEEEAVFARAVAHLPPLPESFPPLAAGPFAGARQVQAAMIEVGRLTVASGLVDSSFGNVSYCLDDVLYISQTGSFLDELEGVVDPCPLDGSSCAGLTASSEFLAHERAVLKTGAAAILHGHPKFAVILSMACERPDCPHRERCHLECPERRRVAGTPVVTGEVGTGPRGLCETMPQALVGEGGVIVLGHGLFTVGRRDFNEAFAAMLETERRCREEYFRLVAEAKAS